MPVAVVSSYMKQNTIIKQKTLTITIPFSMDHIPPSDSLGSPICTSSCPVRSQWTIIEATWTTFGGSTEIDTKELHGSCGSVLLGAVLWVLFVFLFLFIGVSIRTCRHAATGMIADERGMGLSVSCSDCLAVGWGLRCRSVGFREYIQHNNFTYFKLQQN